MHKIEREFGVKVMEREVQASPEARRDGDSLANTMAQGNKSYAYASAERQCVRR